MNPLYDRLQGRATRTPSDIVLEGGGESLSAVELLARVQELGLWLNARDVRTVGLLADNSPGWAIVDLACQFHDLCLVPVPTFFSPSQREHLLLRAGVELLFVEDRPGQAGDTALRPPAWPGFRALPLAPAGRVLVPAQTSKITFTSGSTGAPRGVCLSSGQCLAVAQSLARSIGLVEPRHLCVLPLSTLLENIGGIYMPLLAGGRSLILPAEELGLTGSSGVDPAQFLAALTRCEPDTLILVPELLALLDRALQAGWRAPASLRFVAVGGARVAPALVQRVRDRGLPVYEGYGLSECASVVSLNTPGGDRVGSSGRVLPHVSVAVTDGQLTVTGNTFLGYLNEPRSWGAEVVATGDLGRVDPDGFVFISGRRKHLLITSFGRNISPEWVESELLAGGLFRQAVVVGDGRPCCAALLLPADPLMSDTAIQAEVDSVSRRLPDYARPGPWLRLPEPLSHARGLLTANGRPRRARIEADYADDIASLYASYEESIAV